MLKLIWKVVTGTSVILFKPAWTEQHSISDFKVCFIILRKPPWSAWVWWNQTSFGPSCLNSQTQCVAVVTNLLATWYHYRSLLFKTTHAIICLMPDTGEQKSWPQCWLSHWHASGQRGHRHPAKIKVTMGTQSLNKPSEQQWWLKK